MSGVTIWTSYQILILWSYANGFITQINYSINPFWFVAIFFFDDKWNYIKDFNIYYWDYDMIYNQIKNIIP